jgi:hypothetical protein
MGWYQLVAADGDVFGEAEYSYQPQPGDEIIVSGTRWMRVVAVVPMERLGGFVDRPLYGMLEVEPA